MGAMGALGVMGVKYDNIALCHFTYNLLCKGTCLFCREVTKSLPGDEIAYHDGYYKIMQDCGVGAAVFSWRWLLLYAARNTNISSRA
jgi:hypothetical protein